MKGVLRLIKKLLVIIFFSGLGVVVLAFSLTYIFEDKIKDLCIRKLNQNLNTEVHINGKDIHLSFFSHFPNAALTFENFEIRESFPGSAHNLAEVEFMALIFSPLDLIRENYEIYGIALKDAEVTIRHDINQRPNYEFWKTSDTSTGDKTFKLVLNNVKFINVKLHYESIAPSRALTAHIEEASFSGRFTDDVYDLDVKAAALVENYSQEGKLYVSNKHIILQSGFKVDNTTSTYTISKGSIDIEEAQFALGGSFQNIEEGVDMHLKITSAETGMRTLMSLLPKEYNARLADYNGTGNIQFSMIIEGISGPRSDPSVKADFSIRDAVVIYKDRPLSLEKVNLTGHYDNGLHRNLTSSTLLIESFTCSLNGREVSGSLELTNFADPYLNISLIGEVLLADLHKFTEINGVKDLSGAVFLDASFKGNLNDLKAYGTIGKTKLSGKVMLHNVNIIPDANSMVYKDLNGEFTSDGNNLLVQNFTGKMSNTDFRLNGSFKNLASFLFLPDQQLQAVANLQCKYIDISDFISQQNSSNATQETYRFTFPPFLLFDFRLTANKIVYGKFSATGVSGKINMKNNKASMSGIHFKTMGGQVDLNGTIKAVEGQKILIETVADLQNIDVTQLFYQLDNFGQNYITDKHLKGKLNASITFSSKWNDDLTADLRSIVCNSDISIDDGRIKQLSTFVEMGDFLHVSSLDDLQFDRLSNRISIEEQVINIPKMDINSSAMNMTIAGTHTFDNFVDYRAMINMSHLLFGKKTSYEDEFGIIEVDEKGGMKLFLHIKGPGEDPKIAYDAAASGKNIKKGLIEEKNEIKNIFTRDTYPDGSLKKELNTPRDDYELKWDEEEAPTGSNLPIKNKAGDADRKKAFEDLKKKISTKNNGR